MILKCEKCGADLRGKRVWDDYDKAISHLEYFCQNDECIEYTKVIGYSADVIKMQRLQVIFDENVDLKVRLTALEKELGI